MRNRLVFAGYSLVLLVFSIWSYLYLDWHLVLSTNPWYQALQKIFWDFSLGHRHISTAIYVVSIVGLYLFYLLFLKLVTQKKLTQQNIFFLTALAIGILFFSQPALSHDIYNYIMSAKIVTYYYENPWMVMPIEFSNEPMLNFLHAANKTVLYGPFWVLITLVPSFLGQNIFLLTFVAFKAIIILFFFLTLKLILLIGKEIFHKDNILALSIFALNPLVLIETLSSSHNDIVMIFFALLSFLFLYRRKIFLSLLLLVLSIGVKYATIVLIPVYLFAVVKTIKKEKINWERIFFLGFISLMVIFLLSPLREEIYPWYLIWPLSFLILSGSKNKLLIYLAATSVGLMMRYVPYMLTYSWFGYAPLFKKIVTFLPAVFVFSILKIKKYHA